MPSKGFDRRDVLRASALLAASAWAPIAAGAAGVDHRDRIKRLIGEMTLAEKLGQMTQIPGGRQRALNSKLDAAMLDRVRKGEVGSFLHVAGAEPLRALQRIAVEESRLKIPLLFAMDVIHGYRTTMPVPLALAASWDPETVRAAARVAATEASVSGLHWTFAPMVDVARDARWGRIVEGAGEDPYLGARMAVAQVEGFQTADLAGRDAVMACAKHFAGYGAAIGGRDYDSAELSERTLNEVYLPPFHAAAMAGAGSFMTAFNDVGGVPMTANPELVRGVLHKRWGWQGLVVSDWNAILELVNHGVAATPVEAAALALRGGVDMDMASSTYPEHLGEAAKADPTLLPLIDQAVGRILAAKARLGLFDDPYRAGDPEREKTELLSAEHRKVAREAARRSIVLLRNEGGVLPLAGGEKVALIGPLAGDASSTLGPWRGRGQIDDARSLRQVLSTVGTPSEYVAGIDVKTGDVSGIPAAVAAAQRADVVWLVLGEDYDLSGEARSRADIGLPGPQQQLIDAVKATGKPIVAILMNGRPLALEKALEGIPAVLETWFLGLEGGMAILEVLMGHSPGGRLPAGMPRVTGQSPMSYAHVPTGRPANTDLTIDSARYHDTPIGPLFPFGHGLSYSKFNYSPLTIVPASGGGVRVSVEVTNTGNDADEVVQLYVRDPVATVARPVKELRGFARVAIPGGKTRRVTFTLSPAQFAIWSASGWRIEKGRIELMVGASSDDIRATGSFDIIADGMGNVPAAAIETKVEVA